jgi:death-on-curing protein
MPSIAFLTLADVVEIHNDQISRYGGHSGVRDIGLLESALAMPVASFQNEWFHKDIYEMAAAYAWHLCSNHPFYDGNKRTALAAALVFLLFNGIDCEDPGDTLYDLMIAVASGKLTKQELAHALRRLSKST